VSEPEPPLLSVRDLGVEFRTRDGVVRAVDRVSFDVRRGETVALVGESGSGKSVTAFALLRILEPAGRITGGSVEFGGLDLVRAGEAEMALQRGRELAMIFQNPRTALNPIRSVGDQIADVLRRHANLGRGAARSRAVELLAQVQIPDPQRRQHAFPFELSGGMCQRVMIAIALACAPALLIADEPTTGLDVTTQAAIMDLVAELAARTRMATLLITHDLALAAERCDRIAVMHAGHVVEVAPTAELFAAPRHPYTARLIAATPRPGVELEDLEPVPGALPDLRGELPPCRYSARCDRYGPPCDRAPLDLVAAGPGRAVACWKPL
jgi:peptide/nickel transport system ATP-binding protein